MTWRHSAIVCLAGGQTEGGSCGRNTGGCAGTLITQISGSILTLWAESVTCRCGMQGLTRCGKKNLRHESKRWSDTDVWSYYDNATTPRQNQRCTSTIPAPRQDNAGTIVQYLCGAMPRCAPHYKSKMAPPIHGYMSTRLTYCTTTSLHCYKTRILPSYTTTRQRYRS